MDYSVPSVDQIIEEALISEGGEYAAGKLLAEEWERWEVLDDRAITALNDAIQTIQRARDAAEMALSGCRDQSAPLSTN